MSTLQRQPTGADEVPDDVSDVKPHPGLRMTEEEFVDWVDSTTWAEWVDGEVVMMSPVSGEHDDVGGWLRSLLLLFTQHHDLGRVRGPEFMVRLGPQRRRRVPDVLYVAKSRLDILRPNHAEGAPDLIIEVVSPDSESRDWREKYADYQDAAVREYWVVDPMSQHVEAYPLGEDRKYHRVPQQDRKVTSTVVPGFFIKPEWLWEAELPSLLEILRESGVG